LIPLCETLTLCIHLHLFKQQAQWVPRPQNMLGSLHHQVPELRAWLVHGCVASRGIWEAFAAGGGPFDLMSRTLRGTYVITSAKPDGTRASMWQVEAWPIWHPLLAVQTLEALLAANGTAAVIRKADEPRLAEITRGHPDDCGPLLLAALRTAHASCWTDPAALSPGNEDSRRDGAHQIYGRPYVTAETVQAALGPVRGTGVAGGGGD
jgi:hypothetical protein